MRTGRRCRTSVKVSHPPPLPRAPGSVPCGAHVVTQHRSIAALEGAKEDSEPTMRCLVLQTLLILSVLEDVPPTRPRLRRWFWRTWRE